MAQVTLRNTKGTPLTYTEVDNNFKFCDSDTNLIINGGMNIWQRGTSFTAPADAAYAADRFSYRKNGTMVHDVSRSTDVPTQAQSGVKTNFSLLVDCTTADTSIASADRLLIQYAIEGYDYAQVEGNTYTLSFWVKGTKTGVHCISFRNTGGDRSYVVEYTINSTNTWEYKTITVTFDYSGGTWNYTNGIGIIIGWALAAGTDFQTTADAWQTGNFFATSNQVNAADSTSNDFRIATVKFEPGSEATQFRFRHFERELSLCQRYFEKSYSLDTTPGTATSVGNVIFQQPASTMSLVFSNTTFKVSKRATPTMTWYSTSTGTAARVTDDDAGADKTVSNTSNTNEYHTGFATVSSSPADQSFIRAQFTADSEL